MSVISFPMVHLYQNAKHLLQERREVRHEFARFFCFSAGIGRTGTLLTIDTCMKHIERGLEVNNFRHFSKAMPKRGIRAQNNKD